MLRRLSGALRRYLQALVALRALVGACLLEPGQKGRRSTQVASFCGFAAFSLGTNRTPDPDRSDRGFAEPLREGPAAVSFAGGLATARFAAAPLELTPGEKGPHDVSALFFLSESPRAAALHDSVWPQDDAEAAEVPSRKPFGMQRLQLLQHCYWWQQYLGGT